MTVVPESLRSHSGNSHKFQHAICRMCLRPKKVRPLTRHHLVPASWFRQNPGFKPYINATANLIPLCRPCHDDVDNRRLSERMSARRLLRRSLAQQEIAFAISLAGEAWLDREYPA